MVLVRGDGAVIRRFPVEAGAFERLHFCPRRVEIALEAEFVGG